VYKINIITLLIFHVTCNLILKLIKIMFAYKVNGPPPSLAEQLKIVLAERESRLSESHGLYSSDHNSSTSSFADEIREASLNCKCQNLNVLRRYLNKFYLCYLFSEES